MGYNIYMTKKNINNIKIEIQRVLSKAISKTEKRSKKKMTKKRGAK